MSEVRPTILLAALVLCHCLANIASAGAIGIDQRNDSFTPSLFQNILFFSPMGQTFTPTFSSLNFVDLYTDDFGTPAIGLFVNIRAGTISGPIIGTSNTVTGSPSGETDFPFPADVPLVSGNVYVIEVGTAAGGSWGIGSADASTYSGGTQILSGQPVAGNDLWFREGSIPEPGGFSLLLIACGVFALKCYAPHCGIPRCHN